MTTAATVTTIPIRHRGPANGWGNWPPQLARRADDYICKPFSPREEIARVKAVLHRTRNGQTIQAQRLILDEQRYRPALFGHDLELTAVEFKLLQLMAANPGRIYGRQQLMDKIYPDERIGDRTIDSHIKKLRRKIEAVDPKAKLVHSVYGVGYKFEADSS